jgi:hypothetical protein
LRTLTVVLEAQSCVTRVYKVYAQVDSAFELGRLPRKGL